MARKLSSIAQAKQVMDHPATETTDEIWHLWKENPLTHEVIYIGTSPQRGTDGFYLTPQQHEAIMTDDDTIVELR